MDIPFNILVLFLGIAFGIGLLGIAMGLKKIAGAPVITVFAGILIIGLLALTDNIIVEYTMPAPANTTEFGGNLTCTTGATFDCDIADIQKRYSYYNSTGHLTQKPDAQAVDYAIKENDVWVYLILLGIIFIFLGVLIQFQKW